MHMPEEPLPPGEEGAVAAVLQVTLHGIRLSLEGDVAVGLVDVAVAYEPDEPFRQVPYEEEHEEHLALLHGMYVLMVEFYQPQPPIVAAGKDQAKQVYCPVGTERKKTIINDVQRRKGLKVQSVLNIKVDRRPPNPR